MQKSQRTRRLALAFFPNDSIRLTPTERGVAEVAVQWSRAFISRKSARSFKTQRQLDTHVTEREISLIAFIGLLKLFSGPLLAGKHKKLTISFHYKFRRSFDAILMIFWNAYVNSPERGFKSFVIAF